MMQAIEWVEVSPRDGLQNEPTVLPTAAKLTLIHKLVEAGARRIEVASFVNPRRVPQMADAEAVCAALPAVPHVTYIGLALNERGAARALATSVHEIGAVAVASDELGLSNQGQTSAESIAVAARVIAMTHAEGRQAQVTIAASFGCPYSGAVPESRVVAAAKTLAAAAPSEIALADTIGVADPAHVERLVTAVAHAIAPIPVRVHFHNTRGAGLANVWAAVRAGAQAVDGSLGGIGGCPFAGGAAGNVATEDIVTMLERAGIATGLDIGRLIEAARWLSQTLGKPLPAFVSRLAAAA